MADESTNEGAAQPLRIKVDIDAEVREWARKLNATPTQIREAVQAVGDRADDVEMHLKGTRASTNAAQEERGEREPDD